MSSHFKLKSLAFYGIAIGLVLLLFRVVTAYGEANLKAPPAIDGRYRLSYSSNPGCPQPKPLVLTVEQSGTYLHGSLSASDTAQQAKFSEKKSSLTGQLHTQQLSLTGIVPSSNFCDRLVPQSEVTVSIQSQVEGKGELQGQITLSGISKVIEFTAQKEAPNQPSEKSPNH